MTAHVDIVVLVLDRAVSCVFDLVSLPCPPTNVNVSAQWSETNYSCLHIHSRVHIHKNDI